MAEALEKRKSVFCRGDKPVWTKDGKRRRRKEKTSRQIGEWSMNLYTERGGRIPSPAR